MGASSNDIARAAGLVATALASLPRSDWDRLINISRNEADVMVQELNGTKYNPLLDTQVPKLDPAMKFAYNAQLATKLVALASSAPNTTAQRVKETADSVISGQVLAADPSDARCKPYADAYLACVARMGADAAAEATNDDLVKIAADVSNQFHSSDPQDATLDDINVDVVPLGGGARAKRRRAERKRARAEKLKDTNPAKAAKLEAKADLLDAKADASKSIAATIDNILGTNLDKSDDVAEDDSVENAGGKKTGLLANIVNSISGGNAAEAATESVGAGLNLFNSADDILSNTFPDYVLMIDPTTLSSDKAKHAANIQQWASKYHKKTNNSIWADLASMYANTYGQAVQDQGITDSMKQLIKKASAQVEQALGNIADLTNKQKDMQAAAASAQRDIARLSWAQGVLQANDDAAEIMALTTPSFSSAQNAIQTGLNLIPAAKSLGTTTSWKALWSGLKSALGQGDLDTSALQILLNGEPAVEIIDVTPIEQPEDDSGSYQKGARIQI